MAQSPAPAVVSFEDARHFVEQHAASVRATRIETTDLLHAGGRVLAESILADRDFPPFHRAARDGFALRAADVAQVPAILKISGEVRAGVLPEDIPQQVG